MKAIEYWLARAALASAARFPPAANFYFWLIDHAVPKLRRTARRNLEIAGFRDEGLIDGVFRSLARMLVIFSRFPRLTPANIHELIRYEGFDNFNAALDCGKGVLVATIHLGNWELSAFSHALMAAPMNIVVRPLDNPRIDALVEHYRALSGNRIISKRDAARDILRALHANQAVGILIDQNTAADEGVFIDFFGAKACAGAAFARLAHHSGAAVVPGYAVWSAEEQKYVLHFDPPIEMTGDVLIDTQRIHTHLETVIRRYPDQWLWIHRRWKTRPPGEESIYKGT